MQSFNVVIALDNCIRAEHLAIALHPFFKNVSLARDEEELRHKLASDRTAGAVIDLELLDVDQVAVLCKDFAGVNVVCAHRVPDEALWMKTLAAGASDCCCILDFRAIQEALTPRGSQMSLRQKHQARAA